MNSHARDYVAEALNELPAPEGLPINDGAPFPAPEQFGFPANGEIERYDDELPPMGTVPDAKANRFELEMLDDVEIGDDPAELVQGLLPMGPALGVAFGPPKSLKSFLLTHIGVHIADNRPFCGRAVQGGAVAYVTSEGIRGVRRRLIVARRAMGVEGRNVPFALVPTMPNLGAGEGDRIALQKEIDKALMSIGVPLRMIVIDTMRRAMPGKSENEQKDVSIVVDNCEALARAFGCLVVLVHHSPRSDDQRGSGSNALDAAADVMWSVIRDENRGPATASVVRYKDGEEGDTWTFDLRPLEIGMDREGNPISSCYVDVTLDPARKSADRRKPEHISPLNLKFLDALNNVLASDNLPIVRGRKAAAKEAWRNECNARGLINLKGNTKSAKALFDKARRELVAKNRIACEGDLTWTL
jgi:hypothetical protein